MSEHPDVGTIKAQAPPTEGRRRKGVSVQDESSGERIPPGKASPSPLWHHQTSSRTLAPPLQTHIPPPSLCCGTLLLLVRVTERGKARWMAEMRGSSTRPHRFKETQQGLDGREGYHGNPALQLWAPLEVSPGGTLRRDGKGEVCIRRMKRSPGDTCQTNR